MDLRFQFNNAGVPWSELEALFRTADLGGRAGDKIRRAFENSSVVCFVFDGPRLIGASRALTDGEYHALIYDVVIHPDYQRHGIGRQMMQALLDRLPVWRIMLVADGTSRTFTGDSGLTHFKM